MANIKLNMNDAEYDRIKEAFAKTFIADPSAMTDAEKKTLVDTKVAEYVSDIVVAQDKREAMEAAAAAATPPPPVITPE